MAEKLGVPREGERPKWAHGKELNPQELIDGLSNIRDLLNKKLAEEKKNLLRYRETLERFHK